VRQYLDILRKALDEGDERADRTGVGTRAVFGEMMRFDLSRGFPAVTTKRLAFRAVVAELLWFLAGSSDVNDLHALGVRIWDGNAFAEYWQPRARFPGDAGRNYGQQWRDWVAPDGRHIDQLRDAIRQIREQPASRRMLVVAWNPGELEQTSLPACHALFQFFVAGGKLSLMMYQRSCDLVLGVPFNMAEYALLLHLVAREVELAPHEFVHVLADAHIYRDHIDAAREQLDAATERLRFAEQEVAQARDRFNAGVAGNADVVNASLALTASRTLVNDAETAYQLARVSLARATGSVTTLR